MYQDARGTCRAIVIIITPFVFFKISLTCRVNFVFVKNVMTFKTCPLVRIGPNSVERRRRENVRPTTMQFCPTPQARRGNLNVQDRPDSLNKDLSRIVINYDLKL